GRQREPGDRADHAGGDGKGIAVRDSRRRPHGGRGHDRGDYSVASVAAGPRLDGAKPRPHTSKISETGSEQCPERSLRCSVVIAKSGTIRRPRTAKRHRTVWN